MFSRFNFIMLAVYLPYIFPSSERIIFRRPHGGYMANASWKLCSISGLHTPSASAAAKSLSSSQSPTSKLFFESTEPESGVALPPLPGGPGPAEFTAFVLHADEIVLLETTPKPETRVLGLVQMQSLARIISTQVWSYSRAYSEAWNLSPLILLIVHKFFQTTLTLRRFNNLMSFGRKPLTM